MATQILLIQCPDEKGLVHRITGVLFRHGGNVISNHEFVDRANSRFYMRTEFAGDLNQPLIRRELEVELSEASIQLKDDVPRRILVFATKEPHCLGDLLLRHEYGELNAKILAVISNHDALRGLVEKFSLPFHHLSHEGLTRDAHEARVLEVTELYAPEIIGLAKYMRVLSPAFVARYRDRIVNIHHSFLPAFMGAGPYRQAFERGVKIIGATAHFVTDDLDTGPIIAQSVIPVDHTYSAADMARSGRDVEKIVLARALRLVFEERVFLSGNRTILFE